MKRQNRGGNSYLTCSLAHGGYVTLRSHNAGLASIRRRKQTRPTATTPRSVCQELPRHSSISLLIYPEHLNLLDKKLRKWQIDILVTGILYDGLSTIETTTDVRIVELEEGHTEMRSCMLTILSPYHVGVAIIKETSKLYVRSVTRQFTGIPLRLQTEVVGLTEVVAYQ